MKKILTICGGFSSEREVSINTSNAVAKGILKAGYESFLMDTAFPEKIYKVTGDFEYKSSEYPEMSADKIESFVENILKFKPDKVFVGLHGGEGENGQIQALLELIGIDFTGSGSESSAVCMDKNLSKILAEDAGLITAKWKMLDENEKSEEKLRELIEKDYGYPVVVKASGQGSSVGVEILHSKDDVSKAVSMMSRIKDEYMIEEYIKGRELSIPVINGEAFPVIELIPDEGFYDYKHKYTDGVTTHICPAELTDEQKNTIEKYAVSVYEMLGCGSYARADFILSENGKFYFLEINTLPGMTELSLVPESAKACGISFHRLMDIILRS